MTGNELMNEPAVEPKVKPTRARKAKPTDKPAGKRSCNLSLNPDDWERLSIHALRMDTTASDLVGKLIREHLREYHITRTPTRSEAS